MWGHRFMMPQLSGKIWGLCVSAKREEIGSKLCFRSADQKIRKRSAGENIHSHLAIVIIIIIIIITSF